ncbi:hypothetical protein LZ24_00342 [Desulfobotulus alkaliphilus]|uniref:Uncharacterized protein n=1 Tax=Desulfobotulus alkaliphilus TaxID=622671 RepID=A0A562S5V7_9BACT|nr:hypothetical protein [Desulfobotulus alkaliphilus]TWI76721.1 hypothetical protein LZ24_00342 [Desulfobotulus alkaliphilus]
MFFFGGEPFRAFLLILALIIIFLSSPRWAAAREPFINPPPPMAVFNYPAAAAQMQLRGLVVTEDSFRAVIYVKSQRRFHVVRPLDRVEVEMDGLRHEFRVQGSGGQRRVLLQGKDRQWYEIGVHESE